MKADGKMENNMELEITLLLVESTSKESGKRAKDYTGCSLKNERF
jgi:hypothetical protein